MNPNEERVQNIYRAVVADGGVGGADLRPSIHEVVRQIQPLVDAGEIVPDLYSWVKALVISVDRRDGQAADRVLLAIGSGQDDLTDESTPYLDYVVTLGRGSRKVYRFLTASDIDEMDELRHRNVRTVNRSYHRDWKPVYEAWRGVLRRNITIGAAVETGDLPLFDMALFDSA